MGHNLWSILRPHTPTFGLNRAYGIIASFQEETFADIKQRLATTPGFGEVALLVFDGDAVGNGDTPANLDMEGEECVDVVLKASN